jgi:site-specific DNA-methyltransferase (adenine-specific)
MNSDAGDIVIDPFIGTGTTAIAAKKLGRKYIGIDIDSQYVEITKSKLEQVNPTIINGCYVSIFLDKVITVRNIDWDMVKSAFDIPSEPLELEKNEIERSSKKKSAKKDYLHHRPSPVFVRDSLFTSKKQ